MGIKRSPRRCDFFRTLARCHQAGMTPDRGLDIWAGQLPERKRGPFHSTAQQVRAGQPFDLAGLNSGILLPWEARNGPRFLDSRLSVICPHILRPDHAATGHIILPP